MKRIQLFFLLAAGTLISCETAKEATNEVSEEVTSKSIPQTIDLDFMDKTVRAQDDFFQFSNGNWIKNNPVPSTESTWGSFNELLNSNNEKITRILTKQASSNAEKGTDAQILGDYFSSYTDMEARNRIGIDPLHQELRMIIGMNSKKDLVKVISKLHDQGVGALFSFWVGEDIKNVENHLVQVGQGGIGLPNKDYYFDEDKADIRAEYSEHIANCFEVVGNLPTDAKPMEYAQKVMKFETQLAGAMMSRVELRDPEKKYNKAPRRKAIKMFGDFDFDSYLLASGISSFDTLNIRQPKFISEVAKMVNDVDLETWKTYLKWKIIDTYAGHLDQKMIDLNFAFNGTVLRGSKEMKPIEERAIGEITGQVFSEILGKAFVEQYYSVEAKNRVNEMVDNLLVVFEGRINSLDWMSKTTKSEALNKLQAIGRKLGYPEEWEDFSTLDFRADDYFHNIKEASAFSRKKNLAKLGQPVNKKEWGMPAHMVNAYYSPSKNEIAFPAGIMQPPFFSEDFEDAVNYSRIGMVIGHEFTHGFDDQGSQFSADGNFNNWWTEGDRKMFEARTEKLGNTFSGFCPIEGHCVNPNLTMGENIADLGGLTMAYHAYTMTDEFKEGINRKGYTPAQRFFIGYAQLWKINYTDEALKNRIANDPHSPGMYRVNGPLMNCPEFFEAFDVQEIDPMRNSSDKISKIW